MDYKNYTKQLEPLISFKSISTDPAYKSEIIKAVKWIEKYLNDSGFTTELWQGEISNPVVFGTIEVDPAFETVLVYGHYDVQPANISDGWEKDPFELFEKGDRLIARGVVDNKGQFFIHMYTVCELIKTKRLKYNVKFLIEGNEETSNTELASQLQKNKDKLTADYIMVSDGELIGTNPVIEYSLRGGFNCKITYTTAKNNLHSGLYGGAVPNSAQELSAFLNKVFTSGKVAFDWFYKDVDEISQQQQEQNTKAVENLESILNNIGVKKLTTESELDLLSQVGLRPTIQITGFKAGYTEEGYANIVPAQAEVRLNFRTVMFQNTEEIKNKFADFVKQNTPAYIKYELEFTNAYNPIKIDTSSQIFSKVRTVLETAFGKPALSKPVGGGIPVVNDFKSVLGKDTLLVSLGNDDCNMHGVNENFNIKLLEKGLTFSENFFTKKD